MARDSQHYYHLGADAASAGVREHPFTKDSKSWQAQSYWSGFASRAQTTPTGRSLPHLEAEFSAVVHDNCQKNLMQLAREPGKNALTDFMIPQASPTWPAGAQAHHASILAMMTTENPATKRFARLQRALWRLKARHMPKHKVRAVHLMWVDEAC